MFRKLAFDEVLILGEEVPISLPPPHEAVRQLPVLASTPSARKAVPDVLVGLWVHSDDARRTLAVVQPGVFTLTRPKSSTMIGEISIDGDLLALNTNTGRSTTFTWACQGDRLSMTRPDGTASSYRRA